MTPRVETTEEATKTTLKLTCNPNNARGSPCLYPKVQCGRVTSHNQRLMGYQSAGWFAVANRNDSIIQATERPKRADSQSLIARRIDCSGCEKRL